MYKLFYFFTAFPFILFGQPKVSQTATPPVRPGQIIGLVKEHKTDRVLVINQLANDDALFPIKKKNIWAIDVFTPDMNLLSQGPQIKMKFPNGEGAYSTIVASLGGVSKLLFWQFDKKTKKMNIYGATILQGGEIGPISLLGNLFENLPKHEEAPICTYSVDSGYIMIMTPLQKGKAGDQISCLILDKDWKIVREEVLKLPGLNQEYLLGDALINTDNSIWIPVWTRNSKEDLLQEIWVWKSGVSNLDRLDISLTSHHLTTNIILHQSNDSVYAGGLYSQNSKTAQKAMFNPPTAYLFMEEYDQHPAQGSFVMKIDSRTLKILSKSPNRFSESTLRYWGKTLADLDKGKGVNNLLMRKLCLLPNGKIWLCFENYYYEPPTKRVNPKDNTNQDRYYFGSALFIQYDSEDKVVLEYNIGKGLNVYGVTLLGKSRSGFHQDYSSYFFACNTEKTVMLYNDFKANLDQTNRTNNDVTLHLGKPHATIHFTGYNNKPSKPQQLFSDIDSYALIRPRQYLELTPGIFILAYNNRKDYGLMKVEL